MFILICRSEKKKRNPKVCGSSEVFIGSQLIREVQEVLQKLCLLPVVFSQEYFKFNQLSWKEGQTIRNKYGKRN